MKKLFYVVAPVVALLITAAMVLPTTVGATGANTQECTVKAVGTKNTAGNTDSRFVLNGNGTVSATFEVKGNTDCKLDVTLASWQAPDADKGRPYDQQKLYKYVTDSFGVGRHTLTVELPNCFYQVDLVRGKNPTGPNNMPVYEKGRMMGSLHGGTKVCEEPKTPPVVTTPPQVSSATTLPKTGAGGMVGLFAGASIFGAAAHNLAVRRRASRS